MPVGKLRKKSNVFESTFQFRGALHRLGLEESKEGREEL